jgi:hypothetical protein
MLEVAGDPRLVVRGLHFACAAVSHICESAYLRVEGQLRRPCLRAPTGDLPLQRSPLHLMLPRRPRRQPAADRQEHGGRRRGRDPRRPSEATPMPLPLLIE